jgi:hypothetical protein
MVHGFTKKLVLPAFRAESRPVAGAIGLPQGFLQTSSKKTSISFKRANYRRRGRIWQMPHCPLSRSSGGM